MGTHYYETVYNTEGGCIIQGPTHNSTLGDPPDDIILKGTLQGEYYIIGTP